MRFVPVACGCLVFSLACAVSQRPDDTTATVGFEPVLLGTPGLAELAAAGAGVSNAFAVRLVPDPLPGGRQLYVGTAGVVAGRTNAGAVPDVAVFVRAPAGRLCGLTARACRELLAGTPVPAGTLPPAMLRAPVAAGARLVCIVSGLGQVPGMGAPARTVARATNIAALRAALAADPLAVAVIPLADLDVGLVPVPIDGVYPTRADVAAGRYAAGRRLFLHVPAPGGVRGYAAAALVAATRRGLPAAEFRLLAAGDTIPARGVEWALKGKGWDSLFRAFLPWFDAADMRFLNWESPISTRGTLPAKLYHFRTDPAILPAVARLRLDAASVANNHVNDWGQLAVDDTLSNFAQLGIKAVGWGKTRRQSVEPVVVTRRGLRVAFLAYNDVNAWYSSALTNREGYAFPEPAAIAAEVRAARAVADLVVVSIHSGTEYQPFPDNDKLLFSRAAVDAGADLVVGHHPHWYQGMETYRGRPILYSLGNFIFDQTFSEETRTGYMAEIVVRDGRVRGVFPVPVYNDNYKFEPSGAERRLLFLQEFTRRSR